MKTFKRRDALKRIEGQDYSGCPVIYMKPDGYAMFWNRCAELVLAFNIAFQKLFKLSQ